MPPPQAAADAPGTIQVHSVAAPEVTKGQEHVGLDAVLADLTGQVSLGRPTSWLGACPTAPRPCGRQKDGVRMARKFSAE